LGGEALPRLRELWRGSDTDSDHDNDRDILCGDDFPDGFYMFAIHCNTNQKKDASSSDFITILIIGIYG
jgi:hypothetical protein